MKDFFDNKLNDTLILSEEEDLRFYGQDMCKDFSGKPSLVLLPGSQADVLKILKICSASKICLVPSGGRTGLSAGATAIKGEVVLSFERLKKIISIDPTQRTLTCEAGVPLQKIHEVASESGLTFPVDLGSKGTCQVGGMIATNAGGVRVIKYGSTKDWVLGLKVALVNGDVLDINGDLYKNQTGYDLKSLFVGSEGTLGCILEATLKLTSKPHSKCLFLAGVDSIQTAYALFSKLRNMNTPLSAFEFFEDRALQLVTKHNNLKSPFNEKYPIVVLAEIEDWDFNSLSDIFLEQLSGIQEELNIEEIVFSQSEKQFKEFWSLRELIGYTVNTHYSPHKNDVSVPVNRVSEFSQRLQAKIAEVYPKVSVVLFGHLGDGNIHINILKPSELSTEEFLKLCKSADKEVFKLVQSYSGSISAEHGIGLLKKSYLQSTRTQSEIDIMKQVKKIFDPAGLLNPGKIFD